MTYPHVFNLHKLKWGTMFSIEFRFQIHEKPERPVFLSGIDHARQHTINQAIMPRHKTSSQLLFGKHEPKPTMVKNGLFMNMSYVFGPFVALGTANDTCNDSLAMYRSGVMYIIFHTVDLEAPATMALDFPGPPVYRQFIIHT